MCKFFSCISDGNGKVLHFTRKDIIKIQARENKEEYDFNSHTSTAHFYEVDEDIYNKWEFDCDKEVLILDQLNTNNDKELVNKYIKKFIKKENMISFRNLCYGNSGYGNSGDGNSGDYNSGNGNSGDYNSGNGNSGYYNSGNGNSGYYNSGSCNSGYYNSGSRNSGYYNSGYDNSGYGNSGYYNSGNCNSGNGFLNSFCTTQQRFLFDKKCTSEEYYAVRKISFEWFKLTEWIHGNAMTDKEKQENKDFYVCGGYLKTYSYKEAWSKCPKDVLEQIKQLKNFNKKKFELITGIKC